MMKERKKGGIEYEYSKELIKKFRATSTKWKLNWLEEVNRLTASALTKKEKKFREKIRSGLL